MIKKSINNYLINYKDLFPHERVITERKNNLIKYIKTNYEELIIPSIIICDKTNIIIDGHHRYYSLIELGFTEIPVTTINYMSKKIITHIDKTLEIEKKIIIKHALENNLLPPKSSIHRIIDGEKNYPILLLSKLTLIK